MIILINMKFLKTLMVGVIILTSTISVEAQSIKDILGGVIEGVLTKTNLSLADLTGDYKSEGPAVTFKSEDFLKKAGGMAGATAVETQLKPYYEQYGLNNMTLSIDDQANFTMKIKSVSLKGNIKKNESDGTFEFNFTLLGKSIGKFPAYIEKTGTTLKLMFDASKMKDLMSSIAKITGNSLAKTVGSILDSYEGACVGFRMVSTSASSSSSNSTSTSSETIESNSSESGNSSTTGSKVSNGINALKDLLKKKK